MAVYDLSEKNFQQALEEHPIVLVDFWAPWCGPCRTFAPVFLRASESHPEVLFARVNTEVERGLAAAYGISSIPSLILFREGIGLFHEMGVQPLAALSQLIRRAERLDMDEVRAEMAAQPEEDDDGIPWELRDDDD